MRGESASSTLIQLDRVAARVGRNTLLSAASLSVRAGEVVTIVGPNGGGKTTLLRLVIGELLPVEGEIHRRAGLRLGYVPQHLALDATLPMTAARFLSLGGASAKTCAEALEHVGRPDLAGAQMTDLSGGERQRVLLARAISRSPDLLILDEPTQGLDQAGAAECYRLIDQLRRDHGVGVLMVSHELHVVMAASDHVVCLNGHVCCEGAPETVSTHPEYLRLFGEPGAAQLAFYRHQHDHTHHDHSRHDHAH